MIALAWLFGGVLLPFPRCKVEKVKVASLIALAVDLNVAGRPIYLDMHYPSDKVLLCDPGDDGRNGIPYEQNYKIGSPFIEPHRREGVFLPAPGFPLSPVKYVPEALGTVLALYGMSGQAMARVEGKPWEKPLLDIAARGFLGRQDTLAVTYIPRLRVEQMIRGEWMQLTPFNIVGSWYYCAPEDTVRIRMYSAAMKAVFLRDRVLVKPTTEEEQSSLSVVIRTPRNEGSGWPYYHSWEWADGKEFFKTFQDDTLSLGEWFELDYPILPRTGFFSLDVIVECRGSPSYVQLTEFHDPSLAILGSDSPTTFMRWPLIPTPAGLAAGETADASYPGGFILPRWAFLKQLEMGFTSGGGALSNPNVQQYQGEIDLWEEEIRRKSQEKRARKRRHGLKKGGLAENNC